MKSIVGALLFTAVWAAAGASTTPADAQSRPRCRPGDQLCIDRQQLQRDEDDLADDQADEQWEKNRNRGCGPRCQADQAREREDQQRIDEDRASIRDDEGNAGRGRRRR